MIIYTDMVADLYHFGHAKYLENIYNKLIRDTNNKLYVGIHSNESVESYKRKPVLTMYERIEVLKSCKYINTIIPNAPVVLTNEYIKTHNIEKICIPNNRTEEEINKWYKSIITDGIIVERFPYTNTISTSNIIKKIKERCDL